MKTIEIGEARESLSRYIGQRKSLPLVVTDHGRPVAALLALPNTDIETATLSTDPKFLSLIERSRRRQEKEGGLSSDELRKRLAVARRA